MHWCSGGLHAFMSEGIVMDGLRYCPDHIPDKPEKVKGYKPTPREVERMRFHRWRKDRGDFADDDHADDDHAEELTEEERTRLAKHVLP